MKIINAGSTGDYHIHTSTISDGLNSLDEVVVQAGKLKLKEIAITDHSQAYLDACGIKMKTHYKILLSRRWRNIHNDVNVIFGVEADLLNEQGDICDHIQGLCPPFVILSSHAMPTRFTNSSTCARRASGTWKTYSVPGSGFKVQRLMKRLKAKSCELRPSAIKHERWSAHHSLRLKNASSCQTRGAPPRFFRSVTRAIQTV